jgi:ATPase subunit of ABC transporter with duplicated ATPase domains
MAHLLGADRVTLTLGTRTLLDEVSLGLDDGQRIGVVGPNGAGKSTLLRVLSGSQEPDDGRVTRLSGVRVAVLDQRDDLLAGSTVLDVVHGSADEHAWASDARVRSVHAGLLADVALDADVASLSGGQRRRVALAALLVRDDEVLVLDEPTNHLDVEGVAWLAEHLVERFSRSSGALVVVTHDRWFLDAVCTRTWEVHDGEVDQYEGGYAAYVLARAERARTASTAEEKRQNLLRKELAWLRRGAPARTSKPKFRIDAANALIENEPPPRDQLSLTRMATARLGKDVLDIEDASVVYGDRVLLHDITWRLGPGDRIGLVGVNGAGKTTLLRLLSGRMQPTTGRVKRGKTVQVAELRQDVEDLDELADLRVIEVIESEKRSVVVGGKELTAAQLVERLGFDRERSRTPVRDLSGGERRRLQLLRLLVGEPNVLLLDEPTNDLDTDTLAALEDLLDGWPGTLVVVSHDRYLLERVCDTQMALLGDGLLRQLPGGVEQYLDLRRTALVGGGTATAASPLSAQARTAPPAATTEVSAADLRTARKEIARIERRLSRIADQEAVLHQRMSDQATDHHAVIALDAELRALAAEKDELEAAWLEAAEIVG